MNAVLRPAATRALTILFVLATAAAFMLLSAGAGHATVLDPAPPTAPNAPAEPGDAGGLSVEINGPDGTPSGAIVTLVGITLLSVAPALLLMLTSFTKIFIVLAITRNALGLNTTPPNQVIAGLALFLSLFIMAPVISAINGDAIQPYLEGNVDFTGAVEAAGGPLREWMMRFVIFIPFLIIDLIVSASLMAMGMMMLPPVMISLPFKILLFILVDGWALVITALVQSYNGGG